MNSFSQMVATVGNLNKPISRTVSKQEYELFQKEFVFEKLKGKRFGFAFCEKFNIDDFILDKVTDETAKYHIEQIGYIEK